MIATTTLLLLINTVRTKPLIYDDKLGRLASSRCIEMREWSHNGWPYKSIWNLNYKNAGENLALNFNDATSTFKALQNSPTHKANNELIKFKKAGIANCNNPLGNVTVILFGGK